jgi:type I restriction enzyme M protein
MNHALEFVERSERAQWIEATTGSDAERQELYRRRQEYLSQCVLGIDLNPALVRAAKMNMVMNNDGSGGLWQANTLENPHLWNPELASRVPLGTVDVIVSNPPFGSKIPIDDDAILVQYDLAAVWDLDESGVWGIRIDQHGNRVLQKSQPPEILFIERCLQLLVPGTGRMAMVIPNGILNNPGMAYVRSWLIRHAQILAVVDMQRDLFQPGNDTQTSMVLMRRLDASEVLEAETSGLDYPLFMAVAEKIGHDKRGNVIYRRTAAGEDALIRRVETFTEIDAATGVEVLREVEVTERQIDDELPEVATAYLRWLSEQP